jgi:pyruvate formate lyase activating enzyme
MVQAKMISRRDFLKGTALLAAQVAAGNLLTGCAQFLSAEELPAASLAPSSAPTTAPNTAAAPASTPTASPTVSTALWREVKYYEQLANGIVRCAQCPRRCTIAQASRGFCQTRENRDGKLYSVVYGRPCIARIVPIERAPIYHMLPGTQSYSLATAGCNLACLYCQNYAIARAKPEEVESYTLTPEQVVAEAVKGKCKSITFSYSENTVAFEYMMEIAALARARGLKTILKTGGYVNTEPLKEMCAGLDAINVDLKGFSEQFYEQVCQGELKYVLETIQAIYAEKKAWLEIANLVVPGYNDDAKTIGAMLTWFKENLGTDVPLYFTRFEPAYRLRMPPTPVEIIEKARQGALNAGLRYVYVGNVPGHAGQHTYCPRCGKILIERVGFEVKQNNIVKGKCKFCGEPIVGQWT